MSYTQIYGLLMGVFLIGCQTMPYQPYARSVKTKPSKGGVVALKVEHREEDRMKAQGIMANTCGQQKFSILEEGEVVIGTVTSSNTDHYKGRKEQNVGSLFGLPLTTSESGPSSSTNSTTTQKKEWQISYECLKVAGKGKSTKKSVVR